MGIKYSHLFLFAVFIFSGCSSTSWVVQNDVMDPNDFEQIRTSYYLESTNEVNPGNPIVHFDLKSANTYKFSTRVRTERYIQRYRPRFSYMILGVAGAGLSYYAALSEDLIQKPTDEQRYALMGAGTLLTGLSFLNMKPMGEAKPTGESRLLRKTGSVTEMDTSTAYPYSAQKPVIRISYDGAYVINESEWEFDGDKISINLAEEVNASLLNENSSEPILVEVEYDSLYAARMVEVSDVYEQFAVVKSQITALRNHPNISSDNILTDLAEGSQLKYISSENGWHKVLYGISETYISANDVDLIWRPSEFASDLSVITIPNVPFGTIDVEQNIPVVGRSSLDASALIISSSDYSGSLKERIYGDRDAKLMEEYFIQAFGIRESRIVKAVNPSNSRQTERAYSRLASSIEKDQSLTVYLNGYASIEGDEIFLMGSGDDENRQHISLNNLFEALSKLPLRSLLIFADLDIIKGSENNEVLKNLADIVNQEIYNSAVIFSSKANQRSRIYSSPEGKKNRHSIFTYYLADGIKKGNINVSFLFTHLDRNVTFTSRSLYDRPQNPLLFGNRDLLLVN